MLRCPDGSAGTFEVSVEYLNNDGSVDRSERILDIGEHVGIWGEGRFSKSATPDLIGATGPLFQSTDRPLDDKTGLPRLDVELLETPPTASQKKPYKGELCHHELDWLRSLPGKYFSAHRRYTVKEIKE